MEKKNLVNEAYDALARIKQAEEKAKEIVLEAREKSAAKIVHEAQEEAEKLQQQVLKEAREKAEIKKIEIIDRAKKQRDEIEQETEREIAGLRQKTRTLMPEAVEKIRKKVEGSLKKGGF